MEYVRLLLEHLAWIEHQFLSGIRDSKKAGSLWGIMKSVGGVMKSIYQSWLAKGLGLGLLCWGFKGVQEEILSDEASTLQIGSVAFPPVYNSILRWAQTLLPVTFAYSLSFILYWIHVSHNCVQVLSIPVLLFACSEDWTCSLQIIVSLEA